MAAALSYYTIFSLPPLLILLVLLAGLIWEPSEIQGRLAREIGGAIGPEGAGQIRSILEHADRPGTGGVLPTILGAAALLFGATGAFAQLQAALNRTWNVEEAERGGLGGLLVKRIVSFGMILVVGFLLLVSLALSAVLTAAGSAIAAGLPGGLGEPLLWVIDFVLSIGVITLLFAAMYRVLPDAEIGWSQVWRGALFTAALFVLGKFLLGFYVARSDPGSAFGAAGSLAVILVWVYYSALIFFFGAELTQAHAEREGHAIRAA